MAESDIVESRRPAAAGPISPRAYRSTILIRFGHCDPAGIVFFPRYLEMFNNLIEDWCREELGVSFAEIHEGRGWGIPTVHLDVDFAAPSVLGEVLAASLVVRRIGTSSITSEIQFRGADGSERVRGTSVVVLIDAKTRRAVPIPDDLRARIVRFQDAD
jgi:4-hydroxybenzoyl-CoA thioesterase